MIHVLDIRNTIRPLMPLTLPLSSPSLVATSRMENKDAYNSSFLVTVSSNGNMQLSNIYNSVPDMVTAVSLFAPIAFPSTYTQGVYTTSLCISPSGDYISVGCSNGNIIQYCNSAVGNPIVSGISHDKPNVGMEPPPAILLHHNAYPLGYPSTILPEATHPELLNSVITYTLPNISTLESVVQIQHIIQQIRLANAQEYLHTHNQSHTLTEYPLSSFHSTPGVFSTPFIGHHHLKKELHPELVKGCLQRDFIGYGHNPGYLQRNTLLQMYYEAIVRGRNGANGGNKHRDGINYMGDMSLVGPYLPYQVNDPRYTIIEVSK